MDETITPQILKLVTGEGMPVKSGNNLDHLKTVQKLSKGDLYVKFDI